MKHPELLAKMTLQQKLAFCVGKTGWHTESREEEGLPAILWSDGPHGVRMCGRVDPPKDHTPAISFPAACTTACSWDPDLMVRMGEHLGEECWQEQVSVLLGPGVNMKRHPLCGRNLEYFSEDPLLAGKMGSGWIRGVQSKGVGTSLKHFAVNNQETRRYVVSAVVDERTLREIYLPAFEIAIREAQPWTVMNMYNRLNGIYGAEHKWLLDDILRKEFGFEGMVVTDWGAEGDRVAGFLAGQNLEMPGPAMDLGKSPEQAIRDGELPEEVVDEMADGVLDVILKAAASQKKNYSYNAQEHHATATDIARQCMVLLKNDDRILPLQAEQSLAVIGRMAKEPVFQGSGSSYVEPTQVDTPYDKLVEAGVEFSYTDGYALQLKDRWKADRALREAVQAAREADTVLLFVGVPMKVEAEGYDRKDMRLPADQVALINAVSSANPNVVLVLACGAPVELPFENQVKGLLYSGLAGEGIGTALVDLLYGKATPCGKLADTWPLSLEDTPARNNFPGKATVEYREGLYIGYRYYDTAGKDVRYPFGYGLSYTTFEYSDLRLSTDSLKDTGERTVSLTVSNTGDRDGAEIVQVYVSEKAPRAYRPAKELKAFRKVFLKAGESTQVEFTLDKRAFAFYDTDLKDWHVQTDDYEILVGASSRDIRLQGTVHVEDTSGTEIPDRREELPNYYNADVQNVPDDQFEALLGFPIPDGENHDYPNLTFVNNIEDAEHGKNGALLNRFFHKLLGDDNLYVEAVLQTPIKFSASMSGGFYTWEMGARMLDILNDKVPLTTGTLKLAAAFLKAQLDAVCKKK